MVLLWYSVKMYFNGSSTPTVDGFFQVDSDTKLISSFYNTVAPTVNVLLPIGGLGGNDNLFVDLLKFDNGGVNVSSIPLIDSYGNNAYNIYTGSGTDYYIGVNGDRKSVV